MASLLLSVCCYAKSGLVVPSYRRDRPVVAGGLTAIAAERNTTVQFANIEQLARADGLSASLSLRSCSACSYCHHPLRGSSNSVPSVIGEPHTYTSQQTLSVWKATSLHGWQLCLDQMRHLEVTPCTELYHVSVSQVMLLSVRVCFSQSRNALVSQIVLQSVSLSCCQSSTSP